MSNSPQSSRPSLSAFIFPEPFTSATNVNAERHVIVAPEKDGAIVAEVGRAFSAFRDEFVDSVGAVNHNPYNGTSLRVGAGGESYLLRIGQGWRTKDRRDVLDGMHVFYQVLAEAGVPTAHFLPTKEGGFIGRFGGEDAGHNCTLSPWIESEGRFAGGPERAHQLGTLLGRMHQALLEEGQLGGDRFESMQAACSANANTPYGRYISAEELRASVFGKKDSSPVSEFRQMLAACSEHYLTDGFEKLREYGFRLEMLDQDLQIVHGDIISQNILALGHKPSTGMADPESEGLGLVILDPEKMYFGSRYFDIGQGLLTALRESAQHGNGTLEASNMFLLGGQITAEFCRGYEESFGKPVDRNKAAAFALLRINQNMYVYGQNMVSEKGCENLQKSQVASQALGYCAAMREATMLLGNAIS